MISIPYDFEIIVFASAAGNWLLKVAFGLPPINDVDCFAMINTSKDDQSSSLESIETKLEEKLRDKGLALCHKNSPQNEYFNLNVDVAVADILEEYMTQNLDNNEIATAMKNRRARSGVIYYFARIQAVAELSIVYKDKIMQWIRDVLYRLQQNPEDIFQDSVYLEDLDYFRKRNALTNDKYISALRLKANFNDAEIEALGKWLAENNRPVE